MTRITQTLRLLALASVAGIATPAMAQDASGPAEKVTQVIVFGDDSCKSADADEIVVCSRLPEGDRYRVPEIFRSNPLDRRNDAWTNRVVAVERIGRFGTDSCSPSGLGGFTGCVGQLIQNAALEREADSKVDWSARIAEERAKRLAGIDDAAADVEAAVIAEERRLAEVRARADADAARAVAAETDAATGAVTPDADPLPQPPRR